MNLMAILASEENNYLFFLFLAPLFFFFLLKRRLSNYNPPLPPGPSPWPLVGNIFQLGDSSRPPYAVFADLSKSYGPLISLKFGSQTAVIASSPAAAKEILKTHDKSLSGRPVTPATPICYPFSLGFSVDCGETWRYLRALLKTEMLSVKAMEAKAEVREKKVRELLGFVGSKEGEIVDVGSACYASVMNMLTDTVVSVDFLDFQGKGIGEELKGLITKVGELTRVTNLGDVFPILRGLDVQGLGKKRKQIVGRLVRAWEGIVAERRKQGVHSDPSTRDFLDTLIENGLNDGQINQIIMVSGI